MSQPTDYQNHLPGQSIEEVSDWLIASDLRSLSCARLGLIAVGLALLGLEGECRRDLLRLVSAELKRRESKTSGSEPPRPGSWDFELDNP